MSVIKPPSWSLEILGRKLTAAELSQVSEFVQQMTDEVNRREHPQLLYFRAFGLLAKGHFLMAMRDIRHAEVLLHGNEQHDGFALEDLKTDMDCLKQSCCDQIGAPMNEIDMYAVTIPNLDTQQVKLAGPQYLLWNRIPIDRANPKKTAIQYSLCGSMLGVQGYLEDALLLLAGSLKVFFTPEASLNLAKVFLQHDKWDDALLHSTLALNESPTIRTYMFRGQCYESLGDNFEALQDYLVAHLLSDSMHAFDEFQRLFTLHLMSMPLPPVKPHFPQLLYVTERIDLCDGLIPIDEIHINLESPLDTLLNGALKSMMERTPVSYRCLFDLFVKYIKLEEGSDHHKMAIAHTYVAVFKQFMGEYQESKRLYQTAISYHVIPQTLYQYISALLLNNELEDVSSLLDQAVMLDSGATFYTLKGRFHLKLYHTTKSAANRQLEKACLAKAIKIQPNHPALQLAHLRWLSTNSNKNYVNFPRMGDVMLYPYAITFWGHSLMNKGLFTEAKTWLNQLGPDTSSDANILTAYARLLSADISVGDARCHLHARSKLIEVYKKTAEVEPNNGHSRGQLGTLYFQEAKLLLAVKNFEEQLTLATDKAQMIQIMGTIMYLRILKECMASDTLLNGINQRTWAEVIKIGQTPILKARALVVKANSIEGSKKAGSGSTGSSLPASPVQDSMTPDTDYDESVCNDVWGTMDLGYGRLPMDARMPA